jgi:hypothetical protein
MVGYYILMRKYFPLYAALILALLAAIYWVEHEEEVAAPEVATVKPKAVKARRKWLFLPPVSYIVR